jgi:hypothetical protein
VSASTLPADLPVDQSAPAKRRRGNRAARVAAWVVGIPLALLVLLYLVLLVTPIRLPFGGGAVRSVIQSALPPTSNLDLGDMALALEGGAWPVIRFSPVVYTDTQTGARIGIDALEIGFSPLRALIGQPGATVAVVGPHIQLVQDLYGPRPTTLEVIEDPSGGPPTVRVQEGQDAFSTEISAEGIRLSGAAGVMRSDNDWLIYNLESAETSLQELVNQTRHGRFSRLTVRDGTVEMIDAVYGLFRKFEGIELDIGADDAGTTAGTFAMTLGGQTMMGSMSRAVTEAGSRLEADIVNIDFSAFLPFIDDASSVAAVRGAGAVSIDVNFEPAGGKLVDGDFKIDMTGLDLRIEDAYFPIASSIMDIHWDPVAGQFTLDEAAITIGQSRARISGVFAMGLDADYGPTIGMSMTARDVYLHPNDMAAPATPFDTMEFSGWSAPLYGALGIDRFLAQKGDGYIETTGRINLLTTGLGVDMTVAGDKISADDFKRIWPYLMGAESRDWFVANVPDGTLLPSRMEFHFPVGTLSIDGEERPVPPGAMMIDIAARGVSVKPMEGMEPILLEGDFRLQMKDADVVMSAGGGRVATAQGDIVVSNPALFMDETPAGESIVEISGDLNSPIPAALALVEQLQPEALAGVELPIELTSLEGDIDLGLLATIVMADEEAGTEQQLNYVINGTVADFGSTEPIQGIVVDNGQMAFSASQDSYQLGGTVDAQGVEIGVEVAGTPEGEPNIRLGATISAAELADMGIDVSQYMGGELRFVAQPMADGAIGLGVDLTQTSLTIRDIGLTKAAGTAGTLTATARMNENLATIENIDLAFGTVRAQGSVDYDLINGLQSANFTQLALSEGDSARLAMTPMSGGYAVTISGEQLDLKPMLSQFFSLGQGSGGVQTAFEDTISLDVQLDRALGYYATTAFNVDLDLLLAGADLRRVNMTAQFSEGNALSVTTNPAPNGRTLSVAFNDAGTLLRLVGVYSQLAGGSGNLVMTTDREQDLEAGQLVMNDFAIVDEANVAQVLGNHSDSRAAIAQQNRLDFDGAQVDFIRRDDRVEVQNAVLAGDTVGGTLRGFIYTNQRTYDLTGTYVPLFGLNNAFQQIPLLGPLLGGRDGEGLVGVTFAVQGPLDNPQFRINPLSILVPGAFRELFEFRAREQPLPPPQ